MRRTIECTMENYSYDGKMIPVIYEYNEKKKKKSIANCPFLIRLVLQRCVPDL